MSPRGVYVRPPRQSSQRPLAGEDLTSLSSGGDTISVFITPFFRGEDQGDGGVRRVIEGQIKHFPKFGIKVVDDPADADLLVVHMTDGSDLAKKYPDKPIIACNHGSYYLDDGNG